MSAALSKPILTSAKQKNVHANTKTLQTGVVFLSFALKKSQDFIFVFQHTTSVVSQHVKVLTQPRAASVTQVAAPPMMLCLAV